MQIPSAVESPRFTDNFSLELVVIYSGSWFNEQRWRWPPRADNDAIFDQFTAGHPNVIFNGPNKEINNLECAKCCSNILGIATQAVLALYPVVITTAKVVQARGCLLEQIAGVKMAIRTPQRDIRTIARVGQND